MICKNGLVIINLRRFDMNNRLDVMKRQSLLFSIFLLALLSMPSNTWAQKELSSKGIAQIEWMSLEDAVEQSKTKKKKLFIMVYGENCEWSRRMNKNTFSKTTIANYLNENYYPVLFDINKAQSVSFMGKEYNRVKKSGMSYHEFVAFITMGRMSTPTFVFFDENMRMLQPIAGYKDPNDLRLILMYYNEDLHTQISWSRFIKTYSVKN